MAPGHDVTFSWRHAVDRRFGAAVDNTRGVVIPARPRLKRLSVIPDHLSPKEPSAIEGSLALSNLSISQGWWVGVFLSVEGRPRARLCRLYWRLRCLLADAHKYRRNTPRGLPNLVIWHNGEIGDVTRNGLVSGAPRTVPSSSGHRNTVLVAALSRTTLLRRR